MWDTLYQLAHILAIFIGGVCFLYGAYAITAPGSKVVHYVRRTSWPADEPDNPNKPPSEWDSSKKQS